MITGPEVPRAILHVARQARRRLLVQAPRVDEVVLDVLREAAADGVEIEVRRGGRGKLLVADDGPALGLSTSFTSVGTGLGLAEDEVGNVETVNVVEDPEAVALLLGGATAR